MLTYSIELPLLVRTARNGFVAERYGDEKKKGLKKKQFQIFLARVETVPSRRAFLQTGPQL